MRFLILDSVGLEGGMLAHTPKGRRFEQACLKPAKQLQGVNSAFPTVRCKQSRFRAFGGHMHIMLDYL